jgi:amino acid transporter
MSARRESLNLADPEKRAETEPVKTASLADHLRGRQFSVDAHDAAIVMADENKLHRNLQGRHMQMIAM